MKIYAGRMFLVMALLLAAGCSSLMPKQGRDEHLAEFLNRPEHYALYMPTSLRSEEKLKLFGLEDFGETFSLRFDLQDPIIGVIETVLTATPCLGRTLIVPPEKAQNLPLGWEEPVLFFNSDWQFVYRRVPPSFAMHQLQVGIVAKVIPLGQILSGKGTIALRTASWEGTCFFKAFDGRFLHLDDWAADDGARLRQAVLAAQAYCGEKLSNQFTENLRSRGMLRDP